MGHHRCYEKRDILLNSDPSVQPPAETAQPLPMLLKTCEYVLSTSVVETLKKCRQLKVKGSVTSGKVLIAIEGETIKSFEFVSDMVKESFTLVEDLKRGDKIGFAYEGNGTVVDMKAEIVKK